MPRSTQDKSKKKLSHIKHHVLLLFVLICDQVNGIVHEAVSLSVSDDAKKRAIWIAAGLVIPLLAYIGLSIVYVIIESVFVSSCCKQCCKQQTGARDQSSSCCSLRQVAELLATFMTLFGGLLYFVGDNIPKLYEFFPDEMAKSNANVVSTILLVLALLCYRVMPFIIHQLQGYCSKGTKQTGDTKQTLNDVINVFNVKKNSESHSFVVTFTSIIVISVDFDTWFSLIESRNTASICQLKAQRVGGWLLFVLVLVVLSVALTLIVIIRCCICCKDSDAVRSTFKLIQPWRSITKFCDWCFGIITMLLIPPLVGFFLIADNQQPLDCTGLSNKSNTIMRLVLLCFTFLLFLLVTICFFLRRSCSCVDVKGRLISMNISNLEHQQFTLVFLEDENSKQPCYVIVEHDKVIKVYRSTERVRESSSPITARRVTFCALVNSRSETSTKCEEDAALSDKESASIVENSETSTECHDNHALAYEADIKKMKKRLASRNVVAMNIQHDGEPTVVYKNNNSIFSEGENTQNKHAVNVLQRNIHVFFHEQDGTFTARDPILSMPHTNDTTAAEECIAINVDNNNKCTKVCLQQSQGHGRSLVIREVDSVDEL